MYFEVSARTGNNITMAFNEVAKKLTGIETNPINQSEIKSSGFTLNTPNNNQTDDKGKNAKASKNKQKCKC